MKSFFFYLLCVLFFPYTCFAQSNLFVLEKTQLRETVPAYTAPSKLEKSILDKIETISHKYPMHTGWLYSYKELAKQLPTLSQWAQTVQNKFENCIVLGMGGSSLSVSTLSSLYGKIPGKPKLIVLDTSHPDTIWEIEKKINLKKTIFIVSSKSGTTVETMYSFEYFWNKISRLTPNPEKHFIAITDEGSPLAEQAKQQNFEALFLNPKDIGGRFSALSYFGMIPALIAGYDVEGILREASLYSLYLSKNEEELSSLINELTPAKGSSSKRVFIVLDKELRGFGLWIEQLLSESLGKNGKGVIPLVETSESALLHTPEDAVIYISKKPKKGKKDLFLSFQKNSNIGKFFLLWEIATTCVGEKMEINPFNQPDVDLSKKRAKELLTQGMALPTDFLFSQFIERESQETLKVTFEKNAHKAEYIALLLYTSPTKEDLKTIEKWKEKINLPLIVTIGPRYLHSLGQLYKGGENNGFFIIITHVKKDISFEEKSFRVLLLSQALGDFQAMNEKGRRAIFVNIPPDQKLSSFIKNLM